MKKGFTLIELLIVIGILAILATATILVLNPAQLFAQARDSQRISDLSALKSAISFYLATAPSPALAPESAGNTCGTNYWATIGTAVENFTGAPTISAQTSLVVTGGGWVPVDFSGASGGSPLSSLPKDPTNDATYNYQYQCNTAGRWFEVNTNMESTRYSSGTTNVEVNTADGGDVDTIYEVGNDPGLNL